MLKFDNLMHICGVVSVILFSIGLISFTNKLISGKTKVTTTTSTNPINDPDYDLNITKICPFSNDPYKTSYEESCCHNKTLLLWYVPWTRNNEWSKFWRKLKSQRLIKEAEWKKGVVHDEPKAATTTQVESGQSQSKRPHVLLNREKRSELIYTILVGLLLLSAVAACWEVFKDKLTKDSGNGGKAQDKECSLADFTISRHLRRESQQPANFQLQRQASFDIPAKVTQTLIHQSSLDRTFPKPISEVRSVGGVLRRNSVPAYLMTEFTSGRSNTRGPSNQTIRTLKKQQSLDLTHEEQSFEFKKKPRHFIRRH